MKRLLVASCLVALIVAKAMAQETMIETNHATPAMDEVVVTGEYPGPGLWRVSKQADDGEHVLWIFGTLSPMPNSIKWKSQLVEKIVAESQEIITPGGVGITFDEKIGFFKQVTLIPAILRARKNPDDKKIKELVPTDIYSRWSVQKAKYIGSDAGIEKWRPMFAAEQLRGKALTKTKLSLAGGAWQTIGPIAKEHKIKITAPQLTAKLPSKQARGLIKDFSKAPLADAECFATTIAVIEALGDEDTVRTRANAWARGDLATLRLLPKFPDAGVPCGAAIIQSQVVQGFHFDGFDHPVETVRQRWMEAIEKALTDNRSTFAILPIDELLKTEGRLDLLRSKGYTVEEPT